jgi:hypothetical protein
MVNNFTNVNKKNDHLSSQLVEHKKNSTTYKTLEIQFLFWDGHKHVAGLNRLIQSQWTLLGNWISYGNTYIFYINKQ